VPKDTQSDPNRAATVAGDLINTDKVDIVLVSSTPETTNPVTGQCEANGVPCISTVAPWQPWFLGQQQDPANPKPFKWAYHFSEYKQAGAEIMTGVPLPPDFTNFWKQASQQGFKPKIASVGKALLFPASVEALGDIGEGMSTEVWWSPNHPFKSSLTGVTAKQLADDYTAKTGKQWTQPIGFVHALFEVAADSLKRAGNPDDREAIVGAIKASNLDTIVGHIQWTGQPFPNVAKTPLVGGQWRKGSGNVKFDLVIVSNKDHPDIPSAGELQTIPYA